jgi:mRNA interferase RelE/StbE
VLAEDPYAGKRLVGDLEGSYSYRLSIKDRIIYSLDEKRRVLYVERARTTVNSSRPEEPRRTS